MTDRSLPSTGQPSNAFPRSPSHPVARRASTSHGSTARRSCDQAYPVIWTWLALRKGGERSDGERRDRAGGDRAGQAEWAADCQHRVTEPNCGSNGTLSLRTTMTSKGAPSSSATWKVTGTGRVAGRAGRDPCRPVPQLLRTAVRVHTIEEQHLLLDLRPGSQDGATALRSTCSAYPCAAYVAATARAGPGRVHGAPGFRPGLAPSGIRLAGGCR